VARPGMKMPRVCAAVYEEPTVRERVARPVRRTASGECVRVHRYSMSKQSGTSNGQALHQGSTDKLVAADVLKFHGIDEEEIWNKMPAVCTAMLEHAAAAADHAGAGRKLHRYIKSKQSAKERQRVCVDTQVHYEQAVRHYEYARPCPQDWSCCLA